MNQDTNRPVREQEITPDTTRMDEYWNEMQQRQDGYGEKPYAPLPARTVLNRRAWYNQGWFWLIVTMFGIGVIIAGLLLLAGEIGGVSRALREQTGVLREQSGLLASIGSQLNQLSAAVDRAAEAIRDAVSHLFASM